MKKLMLVSACVALSVGLSACSGGTKSQPSGSDGASKETAAADKPTPVPAPVELTVYSAPGDDIDAWNARYGDPIKKKFPYVTINFINPRGNDNLKIPALLATGTNIDIYYESIGSFFTSMPDYQLQFDHTDLIKKYNMDLNAFEPTLIDAMKTNGNGQIWGIPVNNNSLVMYYNKDIFNRFGVPFPKDGMTWDDTLELAKRLNKLDGGTQYVGLVASPNHIINMNQFSIPFADPKTDTPTILDSKWNDKWKELLQTTILSPAASSDYRAEITALGNKLPYANEWQKTYQVAMYVHQANLPFINESDFQKMNFDMVSLPTFKELPGVGGQSYPTIFSVTPMSKNKDTAFQVIQYLTSPDYQLAYSKQGLMPVLKDDQYKKVYATETSYKDKKLNFNAVYYNKFAPIPPRDRYDSTIRSAVTKDFVNLSLGNSDINTALRNADEEAKKAIQDDKSKTK